MKTFKNIALLLTLACAVPVYTEDAPKQTATGSEILSLSNALANHKHFGFLGRFATYGASVLAVKAICGALASTSLVLAGGVAIPVGLLCLCAGTGISTIPEDTFVKDCAKTYTVETVNEIIRTGERIHWNGQSSILELACAAWVANLFFFKAI